MLRVIRNGPDRLDIEMSGRLGSRDMQQALDELLEKSHGIHAGKMLFDVIDYHLPTPAAIAIELSRLPSMLRFIGKFQRAAVLTDERWLKTLSELEGKLMPGLEIRAFPRAQRGAAEAWLEGRE
ncbi:STAS/SEC14 domain-containing protein [Microbulbifer yueqingensis]|uniref:SpoIIAA-like n=1 Tax=Microbulbifer yueqingensis TaxID=658219 RepID=A0A1G9CSJ2_9GAMM|nr:STAS/SEC14 domain-containing protein [Microbulbifer yueqingensis]SDK54425.1 SpoIIAA-like [Microbulbifer yueqingensis]